MGRPVFEGHAAVIGLGAMGSNVLWRLAIRGLVAVGLDTGYPPHDAGSSHGETRMFRTAYYENRLYVPLVLEALQLWEELQRATSTRLVTTTGALTIGPADGKAVAGAVASAEAYRLRYELLAPKDIRSRFPQHRVHDGLRGVFETTAGYLAPEAAVQAALTAARARGAQVRLGVAARGIEPRGSRWVVEGDSGPLAVVDKVFLCIGPWLNRFVPEVNFPVVVERQVAVWFPVSDPGLFRPDRFPVWIHELDGARYRYGFPSLDGRTIKMAIHHEGAVADPDRLDRKVSPPDVDQLREFVAGRLNFVADTPSHASVCMYTNTPDQHFIVGEIPGLTGVCMIGGCSGHAFKFAPVLAEIVIDLCLNGTTDRDVAAFAPGRPSLHATPSTSAEGN